MTPGAWIRERWPHEARNFTPWLNDNLQLVTNCTGLELHQLGQEVSAAGGRADIVAWEIKSQTKVVIENQIDAADARHFQQLVSYGDSLEARIRIWVASSFSKKFRRLIAEKNGKEELKKDGAIYYLLKIDRCNQDRGQAVLSLDMSPTQSQIRNILLTQDERDIREHLINEFWNQWGRRQATHWNISKHEKVYISKVVDVNEAKIIVSAMCSKGFLRKERIREINSYANRLLVNFPQTNAKEDWTFDEAWRTILEVKTPINLKNLEHWEDIRRWMLNTEGKIKLGPIF